MEPLWAVPHTMFIGYLTLYMLELGVTLPQVGIITSLGLVVHIVFALLSPYITDKFGRRYTTLIFDIIAWGVTMLIWAAAQNIYFFVAAAVINAAIRVVSNSWHCLILEDSEPESMIHIFNFLQIAGIVAGFFAPVGALLINRLTLIPAMRVMLVFGFISMMTLFIIRHFFTTETKVGLQKMEEMKNIGLKDIFKTYIPILKRITTDKLLIITLFLRSLNFTQMTLRLTFLAVLVTRRLEFPAEVMAVFLGLNAIVMLLVLLLITPLLARVTKRWPITVGIWFHVAATVLLLISPPQNYPLLIISAILIALATGISTPRIDALVANTILNEERSVANAIMGVFTLLLTTPFGFIGGLLSEADARLPFILTLAMFLLCLLLLHIATRIEKRKV